MPVSDDGRIDASMLGSSLGAAFSTTSAATSSLAASPAASASSTGCASESESTPRAARTVAPIRPSSVSGASSSYSSSSAGDGRGGACGALAGDDWSVLAVAEAASASRAASASWKHASALAHAERTRHADGTRLVGSQRGNCVERGPRRRRAVSRRGALAACVAACAMRRDDAVGGITQPAGSHVRGSLRGGARQRARIRSRVRASPCAQRGTACAAATHVLRGGELDMPRGTRSATAGVTPPQAQSTSGAGADGVSARAGRVYDAAAVRRAPPRGAPEAPQQARTGARCDVAPPSDEDSCSTASRATVKALFCQRMAPRLSSLDPPFASRHAHRRAGPSRASVGATSAPHGCCARRSGSAWTSRAQRAHPTRDAKQG